jgi:hypothetical protein
MIVRVLKKCDRSSLILIFPSAGERTLEKTDDSLKLADLPKGTILSILVPYIEGPQAPSVASNASLFTSPLTHHPFCRTLTYPSYIPLSLTQPSSAR